jgi:uncharacterized membrane protein YeaQ/YmgE (transglycosylase-associated protein family)
LYEDQPSAPASNTDRAICVLIGADRPGTSDVMSRRFERIAGPAAGAVTCTAKGPVVMSYTLPGLILLLVIAAICGAIGRALAGGVRGGLIVSTALGFIGALIGPWVAAQLKLAEPLTVLISGHPFPVLWSIIGAAIFVAIMHLFYRR